MHRPDRSAVLIAGLLLSGCSGGFDAAWVDGLPSTFTHTYMAVERPSSVWIGCNPRSTAESFQLYEVHRNDFEATAVAVDLPPGATQVYEAQVGPHHRSPVLRVPGGGLLVYDDDTQSFSDWGPWPEVEAVPLGKVLLELEGIRYYVHGEVMRFEGDDWVSVPTPLIHNATLWDSRLIVITETAVGEITSEGYREIAQCLDQCDDLNWGVFHHPANGELWIQEHWRWWSFDGEQVRSLGAMPNPGYIDQVMGSAVVKGTIITVNRTDYSLENGDVLTWRPGKANSTVTELSLPGGPLVGSADAGLVHAPWVNDVLPVAVFP